MSGRHNTEEPSADSDQEIQNKSIEPQAKRGRGRPTGYTPEIGDEICRRMENGETLLKICSSPGMPSRSMVFRWANGETESSVEFRDKFARAREAQAHAWADQCLEISDDSASDVAEDESGRKRVDNEVVQRSKLKIETRRWLAAKVLPQVYGDNQRLSVNVSVQHSVAQLTDDQLLAIVQRHQAQIAASGGPAALPEAGEVIEVEAERVNESKD